MQHATLFLAVTLALGTVLSSPARSQDKLLVPDEYRASCQICHGPNGTGDGPMAGLLTVKPSDLTQLSKKNDGKFPLLKVFQTVDGRAVIPAHGTREMPAWGQRYQAEAGDKYGPYGGEAAVRARVLELVYYIQSIQKD
jgi:mono/diheme cytochrome c family protein